MYSRRIKAQATRYIIESFYYCRIERIFFRAIDFSLSFSNQLSTNILSQTFEMHVKCQYCIMGSDLLLWLHCSHGCCFCCSFSCYRSCALFYCYCCSCRCSRCCQDIVVVILAAAAAAVSLFLMMVWGGTVVLLLLFILLLCFCCYYCFCCCWLLLS